MGNSQMELADKLRKIRKDKKITINELSSRTGLTASFISQLERGLTSASIATLQKIVDELDISLSVLFEKINEADDKKVDTIITRNDSREKFLYEFAIDYILTKPDANMEVIYSEVDIDGGIEEPYLHESNVKIIFVIEGKLEITIEDKTYILEAKDTIAFSGEKPHKWTNIGGEMLKLIWILS